MSMDMSQYLDVFLDEGREQLALLEANILEMERGNQTLEMLQTLFRAAHTLKGSSRAMGFLSIGDLTHEMENILDALRNNQLSVTTPIVNVLLDCLDALSNLVEKVGETGNDKGVADVDIPALVSRLNVLRTGGTVAKEPEAPSPTPPAAAAVVVVEPTNDIVLADHEQISINSARESGVKVHLVSLALSPECVMKSIRVWMALSALDIMGHVLAASPSLEMLEAEEFERNFKLVFASEVPIEEITTALSMLSEIEIIGISEWKSVADSPLPSVTLPPVAVVPEPRVEAEAPSAAAASQAQPVPAAAAQTPAAHVEKTAASPTIRVEVSRLDSLLNLVGELVIDRAQMHRVGAQLHRRYPRDEDAAQLLETVHRITRITGELQDQIMKTRLLPIDGVFQRLPRMVRDLAQKTKKEINFVMLGGETELDRTVLEVLSDPLIHLLRNSVDHGVEPPDDRIKAGKPVIGEVHLSARHEENHIIIEITDDGRGMDPAKLKASAIRKGMITESAAAAMSDRDALGLIFGSGFSTAAELSDISGRGVGMDIVRSNLEKVGGRILVDSTVGVGSVFTIHLPLTLAIVRAVLVKAGGTYVLPLGSVIEMLKLGDKEGETAMRSLGGRAVISLRGKTIPLASLSELLCGNPDATLPGTIPCGSYVVVSGIGEKQIGLCVDALVGEQEVVIKSIGALLGDVSGLSGATILGDGSVALIVDIASAISNIGREHAVVDA